MNTLWLAYFSAGGSISYKDQRFAFKKILQTVYISLPDIIGVMFLQSKLIYLLHTFDFNFLLLSASSFTSTV